MYYFTVDDNITNFLIFTSCAIGVRKCKQFLNQNKTKKENNVNDWVFREMN